MHTSQQWHAEPTADKDGSASTGNPTAAATGLCQQHITKLELPY